MVDGLFKFFDECFNAYIVRILGLVVKKIFRSSEANKFIIEHQYQGH